MFSCPLHVVTLYPWSCSHTDNNRIKVQPWSPHYINVYIQFWISRSWYFCRMCAFDWTKDILILCGSRLYTLCTWYGMAWHVMNDIILMQNTAFILWLILFSEKVQFIWHIYEGGGNYVWGTANPWPRIPHWASKSSWCWYVRQYSYSSLKLFLGCSWRNYSSLFSYCVFKQNVLYFCSSKVASVNIWHTLKGSNFSVNLK